MFFYLMCLYHLRIQIYCVDWLKGYMQPFIFNVNHLLWHKYYGHSKILFLVLFYVKTGFDSVHYLFLVCSLYI